MKRSGHALEIGIVSLVICSYFVFYLMMTHRPVPVYYTVLTNAPPWALRTFSDPQLLTNKWVAEVPFDSKAVNYVSETDIAWITRRAVAGGLWPTRPEKIVIDSTNEIIVYYPRKSTNAQERLLIYYEDGRWRVSRRNNSEQR